MDVSTLLALYTLDARLNEVISIPIAPTDGTVDGGRFVHSHSEVVHRMGCKLRITGTPPLAEWNSPARG